MKTAKEWLETYYPITAHNAVDIALKECNSSLEIAIALTKHALNKWYGLRTHLLDMHGLKRIGRRLSDEIFNCRTVLWIDGDSCTLCLRYQIDSCVNKCFACPLAQTIGKRCDERDTDGISLYNDFINEGDPEPMIKALEETLARLERQHEEMTRK